MAAALDPMRATAAYGRCVFKMSKPRKPITPHLVILALLSGCGDNFGTRADAGTYDLPEERASAAPSLRIANFMTGSSGVRVCLRRRGVDDLLFYPSPAQDADGLSLGQATDYLALSGIDDSDVELRVYDAAAANDADFYRCPRTNEEKAQASATIGLTAENVSSARYSTLYLLGFQARENQPLPSRCGVTFDQPCPESVAMQHVLLNDQAPDESMMIRALAASANAPPTDLCYSEPSSSRFLTLAEGLTFAAASDYVELTADLAGGTLSVRRDVEEGACMGEILSTSHLPDEVAASKNPRTLVIGGVAGDLEEPLQVWVFRDGEQDASAPVQLDADLLDAGL